MQVFVKRKRVVDFESDTRHMVSDIEDLVSDGRRNRTCPFFVSRDLFETADLVLMPYNYLLDPSVREANKIKLANAVVIFDEAHNLPSFCETVCVTE